MSSEQFDLKQAVWLRFYCLNLKMNVCIHKQKDQPISPMVNGKYFTVDCALLLEQFFSPRFTKSNHLGPFIPSWSLQSGKQQCWCLFKNQDKSKLSKNLSLFCLCVCLLSSLIFPASEMAVSGAKSAYFPANSTCLHTLASTETQTEHLNTFLKELGDQDIDSSRRDKEADCIICG